MANSGWFGERQRLKAPAEVCHSVWWLVVVNSGWFGERQRLKAPAEVCYSVCVVAGSG